MTGDEIGNGFTRLGSAEKAILKWLRRAGGPVPRQVLVNLVGTHVSTRRMSARGSTRSGPAASLRARRQRMNVESTVSRALRSLERKGLIVRTFNRPTHQTLISLPHPPPLPTWEQDARAAELFAARCEALAHELATLARRARMRAAQLRMTAVTGVTRPA